MSGTLWIDNVFITGLILDFLILTLTCKFTGTNTTFLGKLLGAGLGSFSDCLIILCLRKQPFLVALAEIGSVFFLFLIVSRQRNLKKMPVFIGYYFCCSFFIGGFMLFLKRILQRFTGVNGSIFTLITGLIGAGILYEGWHIISSRKHPKYCKVVFGGDQKQICVRALVDTGNGLKDPVSGKHAAILEKEIWDQMKNCQKEEKYKVLPYSSVGKKHGVMEGYEIDQLKLNDQMLKHMIVAIYPGYLSGRRSYQMILPPEWIQ